VVLNVTERAENRKHLMERWRWGHTLLTGKVPYYADDLAAWQAAWRADRRTDVEPPADTADVTVFTQDIFSASATALDLITRSLTPPPPEPPNAARDRLIFDLRSSGATYKQILARIREAEGASRWDEITTQERVRQIVKAEAERRGVPVPTVGRGRKKPSGPA
jgi:hypothetical protein